MAVNCKATLFFETGGKYGWSEVFYKVTENLEECRTALNKMAPVRAKLLGTGADIVFLRVSVEGVFRDSLVVDSKGQIEKNSPDGVSDVPWSSYLVRLESGSKYRRSLYLRGVPDVDITNPEDLAAHPAILKDFNSYIKHLVDNKWSIRAQSKEDNNPEKVVEDIAAVAGEAKVTVTAHGMVTGDQVKLRKCKGTGKMNGTWTIRKVDDNSFVAKGMAANVIYLGGGLARPVRVIYPQITDGLILRQTKRDTGRAFFLSRGRAPKKKT